MYVYTHLYWYISISRQKRVTIPLITVVQLSKALDVRVCHRYLQEDTHTCQPNWHATLIYSHTWQATLTYTHTSHATLIKTTLKHSISYDWKYHLQPLGCGGAIEIFSQTITEWMTEVFVEQPLASPGSGTLKDLKVVGLGALTSSSLWVVQPEVIYIIFFNCIYIFFF